MRNIITILIGLFFSFCLKSQEVDLSKNWTNEVISTSGFSEFDKSRIDKLDLSSILSNQLRFEKDPISTYIGIFGPNYRRIDFHLKAEKKVNEYVIVGKSKLGENVRELNGVMKLEKVLLRKQNYITDSLYIGLFNCVLNEPGDKNGDGVFSGVFAVVFYMNNGKVQLFKTSSGDEPNFTNTFVGKWKRYNSEVERKVIFSFRPAGLYESLPFCDELYSIKDGNDDYLVIKDKFVQFGWENFDYKGRKTDWWQ
ncbi:MAG: hypothetical protein KQH79_11460 [Bacteroidetes bacterium]|nr:hypothetical protein [Bacteroidota bacterium]